MPIDEITDALSFDQVTKFPPFFDDECPDQCLGDHTGTGDERGTGPADGVSGENSSGDGGRDNGSGVYASGGLGKNP